MPPIISTLLSVLSLLANIAPLVFGIGLIYLRSQFPHKSDFDLLAKTVSDLSKDLTANSTSVKKLAEDQDSAPNRIELLGRISQLESRVSGVESGLQGIRHQLDTANDYLKILVDRGLDR